MIHEFGTYPPVGTWKKSYELILNILELDEYLNQAGIMITFQLTEPNDSIVIKHCLYH